MAYHLECADYNSRIPTIDCGRPATITAADPLDFEYVELKITYIPYVNKVPVVLRYIAEDVIMGAAGALVSFLS